MPDLLSVDYLSALPVTDSVRTEQVSEQNTQCRSCGEPIESRRIECPSCGAVNPFDKRRRLENNRPKRESFATMSSQNHNGIYSIFKNSDGSYSCNCPSFLKQNEVQNGAGYATCKHIRQVFSENDLPQPGDTKSPSDWQKAALKKLSVLNVENLTNSQAYFLLKDHLSWQGISYREIEDILQNHGKISILPIVGVGIEFESHVPLNLGREGLSAKFIEAGLPCRVTGYNHELYADNEGRPQFKIATDGSLMPPPGYDSMEVVTPKLFGAKGFEDVHKLSRLFREHGIRINSSCATHVHVGVYDFTDEELLALAMVWAKIEVPVLWYLVSPSRRNGSYSKRLTEDVLMRLAMQGSSRFGDRFLSLNITAFHRYKTVEFRLHNGTTRAEKIIPWVIFLMKLVESVKNGLRYSDVEPALEEVFNAVGMDDTAITPITSAREYLTGRFEHWRRHEGENGHTANVRQINFEEIERRIESRPEWLDEIRRNHDTRQALETTNPELPENAIRNLRHQRASRRIWGMETHVQDINAESFTIPGSGEALFTVTREGADRVGLSDRLTCNCRVFRGRGFCFHSINLADYLYRQVLERDYALPENYWEYIRS